MENEGFLTVPEVVLAPVDRADAQNLLPKSVTPDKTTSQWIQFDPGFYSKRIANITGGYPGTTTYYKADFTTDGLPLKGFSLGNATITAKYLKRGRFVIVKVRVVLGTSSIINTRKTQLDVPSGFYWDSGEWGDTYLKLPFPTAGNVPYNYGNYLATNSSINTLSQIVHSTQSYTTLALIAANVSEVNVSTWGSFHATRVPSTYDFNDQGPSWSAGDFFDFQLEYETDLDG